MADSSNAFEHIQISTDGIQASTSTNGDDPDSLNLGEQKRKRYVQDTLHRKVLMYWVMIVVSLWLLIVINVIIANARFKLGMESDVQITLLATTTVNVLGLAYIVLKGLFKDK